MNITFTGKIALVTGAGQGIGCEIAKSLVKCGAQVIALDVSETHLDLLKQQFPSIQTIAVNLADWTATESVVTNAGNIDLLVNNAGIAIMEPLIGITQDSLNKLFDVNIKAVIHVTQLVAKSLILRKAPGAIVNVSSKGSKCGLQDLSCYCATKGAVDAFTRAAALELGPHNIRINCVNPTVIMTELGISCWSDPTKADPVLANIPLGRFGAVHEVADAVLYLLSEKASMITGSCLPVDGGYLAV